MAPDKPVINGRIKHDITGVTIKDSRRHTPMQGTVVVPDVHYNSEHAINAN